MDKELLLVRLPRVKDIPHDFYGIGYYSDSGFIFLLITEDLINKSPLRSLPFQKDMGYDSDNQFEVIGKIKNLPRVKG